jgi:hypothetical protein
MKLRPGLQVYTILKGDKMAQDDSSDPSVIGAIVGGTAGAVAGTNIALAVTALTGGAGAVLAPAIIGLCTGLGTAKGAEDRKSPTSPTLNTLGGLAGLFGGGS